MLRAEMILRPAAWTVRGEFAAGHRDKLPSVSLDHFEIRHYKRVVQRDGRKGLKLVIRLVVQSDSYIGYF